MLLPMKKAFSWLYILIGVFAVNGLALIISRMILEAKFNLSNIFGFLVLSLIIALIASLGYYGLKTFSLVFLIFDIIAIIYLLLISITNQSDGWSDLTSIVGFMFISGIGILSGFIAEILYRFIKKRK